MTAHNVETETSRALIDRRCSARLEFFQIQPSILLTIRLPSTKTPTKCVTRPCASLTNSSRLLSAHKNRVSDSGVNGAPTRNVYNGAVFSASFGLEVIDALAPPDSAYDLVFFPG